MIFKTATIERGFQKLDYRVKVILIALDVRRACLGLPILVVTSTIREKGTHATGRMADGGINGMTIMQIWQEYRWLMAKFPRKGRYKTVLLHDTSSKKEIRIKTWNDLLKYAGNRTYLHQAHLHHHLQVSGLKDTEYFEGHSTVLERL